MEEIGQAGRAEFVAKYTADRNYEMLMGIYKRAIESRKEDLPWRVTWKNGVGVRRPSFEVVGVQVDALELPEACRTVSQGIEHPHGCGYVALTGMQESMEAQGETAS